MSTHPVVLRPAERLARSAPSEIEDARRHVAALLSAARVLSGALSPGDDADDPVRRLASRLADLDGADGRLAAGAPLTSLAVADAAFRAALVDSLDAVRTCRQTLHVSGACWFADTRGVDGCGEVLRTAHAVS